ncbi:uncharacterized protein LOC100740865 isoform X2 [Bombus impatiens]|uniref:Uncharacterized protein LOC100740865 isoform X2 n=1 Tax=Bombus impatiens TaxID=132113 RepID=A0A6P3UTM6_BOMIM|nr:uncharacterized protein LOC100740865 isoform X2 [Bombus impatiens]
MQETSTIKSMISNRNRDCLGCRIFSGCGLIGSGLYVAYHSKKFQKWTGKTTIFNAAWHCTSFGPPSISQTI